MAAKRKTWSVWGPLGVGLGTFLGLAAVVWFWGINTTISGAVIGDGQVLVSTSRTAVSHPKGGVVAEILVENGEEVRAGQVLIRLDAKDGEAQLASVNAQLLEALANEARLEAQIVGDKTLSVPPLFNEVAQGSEAAKSLLAKQQRQLDTFYEGLRVQGELIGQQIEQVRRQILGSEAELQAQRQHLALVEEELANSRELIQKNLVKLSVYYTQQKDKTKTEGDIGRLSARVAELRGRIAELELKRFELLPAKAEKAAGELTRVRTERVKLIEKRLQLLNALSQLEIRAPIDGRTHESVVEGVRSVIAPAKPVMYIVPADAPMTVEVKIAADDIDQVAIGQPTQLRFSAFSKRRTPLIYGEVHTISPDALIDPKTRRPYYKAWVDLSEDAVAQLEGFDLVPGMPVKAFITTEPRSPVSYVTRPLWEYIERAFRDA